MAPEQARAARAILKVGVREVAAETGVTPNTVSRVESDPVQGGRGPNVGTVALLQTWYESQGIQFIPENGGGTGVRLRDRSDIK